MHYLIFAPLVIAQISRLQIIGQKSFSSRVVSLYPFWYEGCLSFRPTETHARHVKPKNKSKIKGRIASPCSLLSGELSPPKNATAIFGLGAIDEQCRENSG
jgi:hypothetical protein